jgi:hypothetical protein
VVTVRVVRRAPTGATDLRVAARAVATSGPAVLGILRARENIARAVSRVYVPTRKGLGDGDEGYGVEGGEKGRGEIGSRSTYGSECTQTEAALAKISMLGLVAPDFFLVGLYHLRPSVDKLSDPGRSFACWVGHPVIPPNPLSPFTAFHPSTNGGIGTEQGHDSKYSYDIV